MKSKVVSLVVLWALSLYPSLGNAQTVAAATNDIAPSPIQFSNAASDGAGQCCLLYNFQALPDAEYPSAGLVMGANGVFYGVGYAGGTSNLGNSGAVFQLAPPAAGDPPTVETVIYNFGSTSASDGASPYGNLIITKSGVLYGTTVYGGTSNLGTVFRLKPPAVAGGDWTETVLYNFGDNGVNDGANPEAAVLLKNGVLYGTTSVGGGTGCGGSGCGTVFELTPPVAPAKAWKEKVLYRFSDAHGAFPFGALIMDAKGNVYGTTSIGGTADNGTVFELTPPASAGGAWTESVLYKFTGGSGSNPYSTLVFDAAGSLYGTTLNGGSFDIGVVFRLTPPASAGGAWTEAVLHDFTLPLDSKGMICYTCPNHGANPYAGLVITKSGVFYGTTVFGGEITDDSAGTIFKVEPPASAGGAWTESVLHSFTGMALVDAGSSNGDGFSPYAGLILQDGLLYGTTESGGEFNYGIVFSLKP